MYDLGVAVMAAWFDVHAAADAPLEEIARAVKKLVWLRDGSPLVAQLQRIAGATAGEYANAVAAVASEDDHGRWLAPESAARSGDENPPAEQGRLLWLHPVYVLQSASAAADAKKLAPVFSQEMPIEGGCFVPGIGWSAVVVTDLGAARVAVRLTMLHWAHYAVYMAMDRRLLDTVNNPRWRDPAPPLKRLEEDADTVFADHLRVLDARARLDSVVSSLGGDELAIWECIAKVQRFDPIVKGVERKIEALQTLARRRVDIAIARRNRRAAMILGSLTVLTVVSVTFGAIAAFLGGLEGTGTVLARAAIVALAVLLAALVWWFVYALPERPRRPPGSWH